MNQQPITKQDLTNKILNITELFYTIQGEGPWQGYPCVFIRLAGCNLRCTWCDTLYSTNHTWTPTEILHRCSLLDTECRRVVITGGEPFVQNITPLVHALYGEGYDIQIETNGTLSNPSFPFSKVTLVCSPKAGRLHEDIQRHCFNYKYVVGFEDLLEPTGYPSTPTQENGKRPPPQPTTLHTPTTVWVMPRDDQNGNTANRDAAVLIALQHNRRLCLQMHKILGVE